ncbi:hypothetical protein SISSUDRAFT_1031980 [Sistotremastrum suecicum HHB10207 ss-3]|uniref:Autophagy-related protein 4 n=1 Tax=Sistotremastrum suecicum HHB10207 ss-3 TaxID=1314776 RepID=A0A166F9T9_9AGAM|nr:hypothetical protein SISSUDRAFT_1031980 [Sistotremastrum suecicum HHB10207 ss-3]
MSGTQAAPPTPSTSSSKLPRFLQKAASNRDRSRSISAQQQQAAMSDSNEKLRAVKETDNTTSADVPVIHEPTPPSLSSSQAYPSQSQVQSSQAALPIPRPRTRSERPQSTPSEMALYPSNSSTSRLGDVGTRLAGWVSHFSTSSTDLSLSSLLAQAAVSPSSPNLSASTGQPRSPRARTVASSVIAAAIHGKDKLVRAVLDSDSFPDRSPHPIWLMGVLHPGYEPASLASSTSSKDSFGGKKSKSQSPGRRDSLVIVDSKSGYRSSPPPPGSSGSPSSSPPPNSPSQAPAHPAWPPAFYNDFTSRVWLTYRNSFSPIRDSNLSSLSGTESEASVSTTTSGGGGSPISRRWNWSGERGWTSDAGWGCMLRTGQSLLAEALIHLHLGRDWRKPLYPTPTQSYATYVRILTWFFDSPSPLAPFSVHRMALAGKDLGKDVGQWFGPSTAAGAVKTLANAFPECDLSVAVAVDGVIYESDVYAASNLHAAHSQGRTNGKKGGEKKWGDRGVLVLIGIRLGIEGVNPIYYDCLKTIFTFPQSVGIAGGRPSSSYYFLGYQDQSLIYLDPHHSRAAIPLRPPPPNNAILNLSPTSTNTSNSGTAKERESADRRYGRNETPDSSDRETTATQSTNHSHSSFRFRPFRHHGHGPASPSGSTSSHTSSMSMGHSPSAPSPLHTGASASVLGHGYSASDPSSTHPSAGHTSTNAHSHYPYNSTSPEEPLSDDPVINHYYTAYRPEELKTFHCEKVRKMAFSVMDPSMLLGFLCKDEAEWLDFRRRVGEMSRTYKVIFSIQDEPPTWGVPSSSRTAAGASAADVDDLDDEIGLESMSEPEMEADLVDVSAEADDGVAKSDEIGSSETPVAGTSENQPSSGAMDSVPPAPIISAASNTAAASSSTDSGSASHAARADPLPSSSSRVETRSTPRFPIQEDDDEDDDEFEDARADVYRDGSSNDHRPPQPPFSPKPRHVEVERVGEEDGEEDEWVDPMVSPNGSEQSRRIGHEPGHESSSPPTSSSESSHVPQSSSASASSSYRPGYTPSSPESAKVARKTSTRSTTLPISVALPHMHSHSSSRSQSSHSSAQPFPSAPPSQPPPAQQHYPFPLASGSDLDFPSTTSSTDHHRDNQSSDHHSHTSHSYHYPEREERRERRESMRIRPLEREREREKTITGGRRPPVGVVLPPGQPTIATSGGTGTGTPTGVGIGSGMRAARHGGRTQSGGVKGGARVDP